jgi:hypothetical protein
MNMLKRGDERIFRLSTFALVAVIALVCMPTVAFGDVVTMQLGQPTTPAPYGVYVDPYPILVTDSHGTSTLLLSCDDYEKEIGVGLEWNANRNLLGNLTLDPLLSTTPKFNTVNSSGYTVREMYDAAAVLTVDLLLHPSNEVIDSYALWIIFDPDKKPPTQTAPGADTLAANTLAAVSSAAPTYLYNQVYIYTAITPDRSQEFIGYVPDGGMTLMLLGGALAGLETLRRRLRA